jgi:hypothetical protein
MSKAPAALGAGEARTWPRWPSRGKTATTERACFLAAQTRRLSWCCKKTMGWRSPTRTLRTSEHQARARQSIAGHGASVAVVGEGGLGSHHRSEPWVMSTDSSSLSQN